MNWLMGFVMGILLAAGYNRIVDIRRRPNREWVQDRRNH
jgi:hypothetical protein